MKFIISCTRLKRGATVAGRRWALGTLGAKGNLKALVVGGGGFDPEHDRAILEESGRVGVRLGVARRDLAEAGGLQRRHVDAGAREDADLGSRGRVCQ